MTRRFDILVYDKALKPFLLVECKRKEVKLTQQTVDQVVSYNFAIQAPYILITNSLTTSPTAYKDAADVNQGNPRLFVLIYQKCLLCVQFGEDFSQFLTLSQFLKGNFCVSLCITVADYHCNIASDAFCSESCLCEGSSH